jgi:hypothetical protein
MTRAALPDSFTSLHTLAREIPCFRATCASDNEYREARLMLFGTAAFTALLALLMSTVAISVLRTRSHVIDAAEPLPQSIGV